MSRRVVGLDIGSRWARAVALSPAGGGWRLAGHAAVSRRDEDGNPRPLATVLAELDGLLPFAGRGQVTASSSDLNALVRFVSSIPMPAERLQRLLRLELSQHAGASGELAADAMLVPVASDELIHCCVLAPPGQVYELLKDLRSVGSVPRRVHFGAAAMYNATLPEPPVRDEQLALLVDIGAASTRVALLGDKRLLACRQLSIGGDAFTEALSKTHDLALAKAEAMKQHWAVAKPPPAPTPPPGPDMSGPAVAAAPAAPAPRASGESGRRRSTGGDDLFILAEEGEDEVRSTHGDPSAKPAAESAAPAEAPADAPAAPAVESGVDSILANAPTLAEPGMATRVSAQQTLGAELTRVAETLYAQLANTHAWFRAQLKMPQLQIAKVLLCGGGSSLVGLDVYLQRRFGLPVERFDPTAALEGDKPEQPHEYTQAIGLALSDAPGAAQLDLLPEKLILRRIWRETLAWPFVAAAALLIATVLGFVGLMRDRAADADSVDAYRDYAAKYEEFNQQLTDLEQQRDGLQADLRSIASRLYSNRDLLFCLRALKELAEQDRFPELWILSLKTGAVAMDADTKAAEIGGRRLGGGGDAAAHGRERDKTIDRGYVEIEGKAKFPTDQIASVLDDYVSRYVDALKKWRMDPAASPLFRDVKNFGHDLKDKDDKAGAVDPKKKLKEYPFTVRMLFAPTELRDITSERKGG